MAAGCGTFPLGSTGLVEVEMHVDETREHDKTARVYFIACAANVGADFHNSSVRDRDLHACRTIGQNGNATADDEISHRL